MSNNFKRCAITDTITAYDFQILETVQQVNEQPDPVQVAVARQSTTRVDSAGR